MKRLTIFVLLLITLSIICPSFLYANKEHEFAPKGTVKFQLHKKIRDPLLSRLQILRKRGAITARTLLVEGTKTNSHSINKSPDIQKAVHNCIPIVISQPTKGEIQAITGIGIGPYRAAVVIPKNGGEEFEINIIRGRDHRNDVHALSHDEEDLDEQVHTIKTIIDRKEVEKSIVKESSGIGNNHKRWTVIDAEPFFWGEQGQFIHVGFQYDLYNVVDPTQRKYLTVQTVGTGVSAGKLYKDNALHRGFFQTQVSVGVGDIRYKNWKKEHLILERAAPESDNNSNTATVSTGATFTVATLPGVTLTGIPYMNNYTGFGITYTKGAACTFHDFTVNHDPVSPRSPSLMQWTYWLSGANGSKIRKEHQAYDLVEYLGIKELPQLAKDSVLMPHMECVYYADGDETGTAIIRSSVHQKLLEIMNYVVTHRTNELEGNMDYYATIDFSEVHR